MRTHTKHTFALVAHFIGRYTTLSTMVLLALLVAGAAELIGVSALFPLLNVILDQGNAEPNMLSRFIENLFSVFGITVNFTNLLFLIVCAICLKALVMYKALKIVAFAAADITRDMRMNLMRALMDAQWQYYAGLPTGKLSNAISTEAESAGHFYTLAGKTIAWSVQTCVYIGIAFVVDWKVSLIAIAVGGVAAFCLKFFVKMAREGGADYTHSLNTLLARLSESLSGAKPLKAMGQQGRFIDLLQADTDDINQARKKSSISTISLQVLQEPILVIFIAVGLFVMFEYANYPITELLLIAFLFYRLIGHANFVQASYQKMIVFEAAVNSILQETSSAIEKVEIHKGQQHPSFNNAITFNNVRIGYGDHIVCDGLEDSIQCKKFNVIFGPSGIGKSTLLDSIMGMMSVQGGEISYDAIPLNDIDIEKLRLRVGYVPQETYLFHDTVFKNVTLGDETITQDDVIASLKLSNAWDFVSELDAGLDHIVGERGGKLSGGQRQRIALARALARKPEILILDEATSGLDKESEKLILSTIQDMRSQLTVIAVSHDPKILDMADHVIHLQKAG